MVENDQDDVHNCSDIQFYDRKKPRLFTSFFLGDHFNSIQSINCCSKPTWRDSGHRPSCALVQQDTSFSTFPAQM